MTKQIEKELNDIIEEVVKKENDMTVVDIERARSLVALCNDVIDRRIEGDFVETGVYKGGMIILMAAVNKLRKANKKIFACDSFVGCPSHKELVYKVGENEREGEFAGSIDEVKTNLKKFDLLDDNIIFVKGWFKDTLVKGKHPIQKISLLRFDADYYSSTLEVLESLYVKVLTGGYIIIDDYPLQGCRIAVHEFLTKNKINPIMKSPYGDWASLSAWAKEQNPSNRPDQNYLLTPCGIYWKK